VGGARLETRSGTGAVAASPIDFSSRGSGRGFFLGGYMASVGVLKIDLHEIVVQSSRNLEFRTEHTETTAP
jgi:hypothetical protein